MATLEEKTADARVEESLTVTQEADSGKDVALTLVDANHATPFDPDVERRVVRKLDLFLMPVMYLGYGLVYYDKAILGSAVLFGMSKDLNLSVTDPVTHKTSTAHLSWATSLFYFGMIAGLYPLTFLSQKVGARMNFFLAFIVCAWSVICMVTAAATTWQGLYAQRFFLGFVESVIPTAFTCIISSFYTQREQAFRQGVWFSSAGTFIIVAGLLNYGFGQIHGSLHSWKYLFILAGTITFVYGTACLGIAADPTSARFLSREERIVAVERLRRGQMGVRAGFKKHHVLEAICDVKIWLVAIMMTAVWTANGAVTGFGPLIVSTFGFSTRDSLFLQFPLGAINAIFILITGYLSSKIRNIRIILLIVCCLPVIAGSAMIWKSTWTPRAPVPVLGFTIIAFFGVVGFQIMSVGIANVAGYTKKCVMAATIFLTYGLGNIIGPQLVVTETKADHYPELWTGLIINFCITIVCAMILYYILWKENKRRDSLGLDEAEADRVAFNDWTDKENLHFRYAL